MSDLIEQAIESDDRERAAKIFSECLQTEAWVLAWAAPMSHRFTSSWTMGHFAGLQRRR